MFGNILSDSDQPDNLAPYLLLNQTDFLARFLSGRFTCFEVQIWILQILVTIKRLNSAAISLLFDYFTIGADDLNCKLLNRLLTNKTNQIKLPRHNNVLERVLESVPDFESVLLLEKISYLSEERMWGKLLEMNLEEIVDFLEEAWAPDTYQPILSLMQNLRCVSKFITILESPLFSKIVHSTAYHKFSYIRQLSHALVNLLTPLAQGSSYQLHYYDCCKALVLCLQVPATLEHILGFVEAYLSLDSQFQLEGDGSYQHAFESMGIASALTKAAEAADCEQKAKIEYVIELYFS